MKEVKVQKTEGDIVHFKEGIYNIKTGQVNYTLKDLPTVLKKRTTVHKATSKSSFFLNVFFGVALLFFVLSPFWMFMPGTTIFRKGRYFTLAGMALAVILIFV